MLFIQTLLRLSDQYQNIEMLAKNGAELEYFLGRVLPLRIRCNRYDLNYLYRLFSSKT